MTNKIFLAVSFLKKRRKTLQKNIKYLIGIVSALIFSIGVGFFLVSSQDEGKNYDGSEIKPRENISVQQNSLPTTENNSEKNSVSAENNFQNEKEISNVPRQTGNLNPLDLSIGSLTIDDSEDKVYKVLGQPPDKKIEDYGRRLKYDSLEVVIRNGKISAFVCWKPSLSTPREIHSGSTLEEVFKAYGSNYKANPYGDLMLYEYEIFSADGHKTLLRCAVKVSNNIVDYISMRYAE